MMPICKYRQQKSITGANIQNVKFMEPIKIELKGTKCIISKVLI